jgi:signal transduction histidine kinase/CheY-like chemotaxis protein
VSDEPTHLVFPRDRVEALLDRLECMAAGEGMNLPISDAHDELDAIAFAVNVLADELRWTHARVADAERERTAELWRAKEEAERLSASKSVFLRTASHEIRTPIAAILGIADQLAYSVLSEDDRLLVDRLRANSRALLSLVGNVLDLSRLDADKLSLTIERVSPLELASEVVKSVEADARAKSIAVRIDSEIAPSLTIETDRVRLRQILVNVVANAVKFTARGVVAVRLRVERHGDAQQLVVDVTDSGIGIDQHHQQYLFEPFGQAHASIARTHGGTGLGLALSSRLAERLGGSLVLLWSEPGRGSAFRLTLATSAVRDAWTSGPHAVIQDHAQAPRALEGVRVLLADDHADLRMAIGRALERDGAVMGFAQDGGEAVALAKTGDFDVVLMDMLMPVMGGLQATRVLRADGCRVPVIALSADAVPEMEVATLEAGCNAQLSKPFDPSDLTALIQSVRRDAIELAGD